MVKLGIDFDQKKPYTIGVVFFNTQEKYMNADITIKAVKQFCKANSSDEQIWSGNTGTYHWNIGKITSQGIVNGVVRKLAGIDVSGKQIWVVAGSLKISPSGDILRFTGLNKKLVAQVLALREVHVDVPVTVTESVTA